MKVRLAMSLLVLMVPGCAPPGARHAVPQPAPEEREVVRTIERLFEGMRVGDTAALRALLAPQLVFVSARDSADHWRVKHYSVAAFLSDMEPSAPASAAEELRERMWSSDVHIDGAIATLWSAYDLHIGDTLNHCGHDAFQLARGERGWYVTAIIYTVRPPPCPAPPTR